MHISPPPLLWVSQLCLQLPSRSWEGSQKRAVDNPDRARETSLQQGPRHLTGAALQRRSHTKGSGLSFISESLHAPIAGCQLPSPLTRGSRDPRFSRVGHQVPWQRGTFIPAPRGTPTQDSKARSGVEGLAPSPAATGMPHLRWEPTEENPPLPLPTPAAEPARLCAAAC